MHQVFGRWIVLTTALAAALAGCAAPREDRTPGVPALRAFLFEEATVVELQERMAAGTLTSRQLVQAYLDRIAAVDKAGPALNSVIELNPDALADADRLDRERLEGAVRGAFHGIPVLVKDNIDAAGMVNSAGSIALADHRPARDAFLVAQLRDAGAVILGKTNLSEWANFRSTRSTSGWSSRGGQTRNPYVLDRNPCGSSSGSGAAVAANLAVAAVGTETDGSIICPAAVNGLVGIKPTVGLVSRTGIIPISVSQDTAGPMARTVADAATLLSAMAGVDPQDPAAPFAAGKVEADYTRHLRTDALRGARIGVMRKAFGFHPGVDAVLEQSLAAMREAGAELVDPADLPGHGQFGQAEYTVLLYEFKDGLNAYLAASGAPHGSLAELIAFNRANAAAAMPWFSQEIFELAEAKGPLTEPAYLEARDTAHRLARTEGIEAVLTAHALDALVTTAVGPAWPTDPVNGDHFLGAGYSAAAVAGTPSITVPAGEVHTLPVGIVFMGPAWSEGRLIALAYAFEQLTQARRPPSFHPTLPQ